MPDHRATVIETYSRRMRIRIDGDGEAQARIKGKILRPVCGDRVRARPIDGEDDWLITGIETRDNALARPNLRGTVEVLAANIDVVAVVAAPSPSPDWFVVDRYLCAAELMRAEPVVIWNKADETPTDGALASYGGIGYAVLRLSARTGDGLPELQDLIGMRTAILVGQSGVGKSSIINLLSAASRQETAGISDKTGEGRHTTVNSRMLQLASDGRIIDSPGVRDFAPAFDSVQEVERGFREIHAASAACRFADCQHLREPDCAVKTAVDSGTIEPRRYESFKRLLRLLDRLPRKPR